MSERQRGRVVSVGAVRGVLAQRGGRWVVDNDSEVRLLGALRGERSARDRLWALAAVLNEGLVQASDLRRLNGRLSAIAALKRPEEVWGVRVPGDLLGAVAYVCVCVNEEMLSRWLGFALSVRLDANLVRGLLPGPGWESWHVSHRQRWQTFGRDVHWISEMPESFWKRLGAHRDKWLRDVAVASDPKARPKVLEGLASWRSHVCEVMDLVACNPRTPTRALRDLAHRSFATHQTALRVAQNRSASKRLLAEMAKDWDWELRYVAAWHPNVPVAVLGRLASDESCEVRSAVAHAEAAPAPVLEALASDSDVWVRRNVASNRSTNQQVLRVLLRDRRATVRSAAAANESTPAEMAAARMDDRAMSVRCEVAAREIGADALAVLAEDPNQTVRETVAWNPQTASDALEVLARDTSREVRAAAASNPNTRPAALRPLAGDDDWWVRGCVATNESCELEVLVTLAGDADAVVRSDAARSAAMPRPQLEALAADENWRVRGGVASNKRSSEDLLAALARDRHSHVRSCVCENDSAPQRLVDALKSDSDYWVRAAAAAAFRRRRG